MCGSRTKGGATRVTCRARIQWCQKPLSLRSYRRSYQRSVRLPPGKREGGQASHPNLRTTYPGTTAKDRIASQKGHRNSEQHTEGEICWEARPVDTFRYKENSARIQGCRGDGHA